MWLLAGGRKTDGQTNKQSLQAGGRISVESSTQEKTLGLTGTAVHPENVTQEKALGLTGTAVHPENVTQEKALGLTGTGRPSILKKHWGL